MKNTFPLLLCLLLAGAGTALASSHREAPLISADPVADNTDVYAFRSPDDTNTVTIICNWIPFQLPDGGPNWYSFGTGVRYEIHIKNSATTTGDDITYRFTFDNVNEDTTTFFNIRLAKRNQRQIYTCQKSVAGGAFVTIASDTVAPANIGPRSIEAPVVGLGTTYTTLFNNAISTASTGERVFAGPIDDPFFVDLGGVFDVGNFRPENQQPLVNATKDGLARYNVHSIALKIPISSLQAQGKTTAQATNIFDPTFVIGVWASSSRQQIRTLTGNNAAPVPSGNYVQVSRLGMPLTNEAIIPIGAKDRWNSVAANSAGELQFAKYFSNPELSLYMSQNKPGEAVTPTTTYYGQAVPALNDLRVQTASRKDVLPAGFDFRNGKKGLWPLKGSAALTGTALAPGPTNPGGGFGDILLPDSMSPRAVDILPIFYTGVPNLPPYQLATGKNGNPLAVGKPFIHNFLPTLGDMLRLNMAVPVTPRNSPQFSRFGIIAAVAAGLNDPAYQNTSIQFIPNMDGFPNGRRLEDDVTTIELQAVSGIALAAIGLYYDDYSGGVTPFTPQFGRVADFTAGPTQNDTTFRTSFPYVQLPWRGYDFTQRDRF